jgi:hypothetical protein
MMPCHLKDNSPESCLWIAYRLPTGYASVTVDPQSIYHWHRLNDRITTSGQPSETQLVDIAALGCAT